jgi:hypothetical protein
MPSWQPSAYRDYQWIAADPQLSGWETGHARYPAVSLILECLAGGMSLEEINDSFDAAFRSEAWPEVLKVASELADSGHVAA